MYKRQMYKFKAFTLAEMMVVMLVLTIILAATAPLMTKKKPASMDNPWRYATNLSDAYYGSAGNQTAMLGQSSKTSSDLDAKLLINNTTTTYPYINFKNGSTSMADIMINGNSLVFGGPYSSSDAFKMASGKENTAFGVRSLWKADTSALHDTAVGMSALYNNTSGIENTAVGWSSLLSVTTSNGNTALGSAALKSHKTSARSDKYGANTAVGHTALKGVETSTNHTGYYNTAIGAEAGRRITSGHDNTAVGFASLGAGDNKDEIAVTGSSNTAIGSWSMNTITTGFGNTSLGQESLKNLTTGDRNVALGQGSLFSDSTGSNNVAIGAFSQYKTISGGTNVAVGLQSLYNNSEGSYNTALGSYACQNVTGSNKTCIGYNAGPSTSDSHRNDAQKIVYIGDSETTVYIPGHLVVDKYAALGVSGTKYQTFLRFGKGYADNASYWLAGLKEQASTTVSNNGQGYASDKVSGIEFPTTPVVSSDKRLKNIKGENKSGLEQIRKLKVFDYSFKADKSKTPRVGVIAQDLQKVFPDAVTQGHDGFLMIRQEDMFYAMINAIKQLDTIVQALITEVKVDLAKVFKHDAEIKQLQKENAKIMQTNAELQAKNAELEKRIEKLEKAMSK